MKVTLNHHPHVQDTNDLTIEPEAAPLLEPATEARDGAAAAQAEAVEEAVDNSSDSWVLHSTRLFEPVLQIPFLPQLAHRRWRFYIVWNIPGHSDWSGVHFSFGEFCSTQIRLHAAAALPHLSATEAFKRIRWCRALGCTQAQLESTYRQEARLPAGTAVRFYWWRS